MPDPLIASSTPSIQLDGEDRPALTERLLDLEVRQSVSAAANATLGFASVPARSGPSDPLQDLDHGRRLCLGIGDGDAFETLFEGTIDGLAYSYQTGRPPRLEIAATDGLGRLATTTRSRVFQNATDLQAMAAVANEHGLQLDVDVAYFFPEARTLVQANQTDLDFLYERARRIAVVLWLEGDKIRVRHPQTAPVGSTLTLGSGLNTVRIGTDLRRQLTALAVTGWSAESDEAVEKLADNSALGQEASGLTTAAEVLEALDDDRWATVSASVPVTPGEARQLAGSYFVERARHYVRGRGEAAGDTKIRAGSRVRLAGLAPALEGFYFVPAAVHRFDRQQGYIVHFEVGRAGLADPGDPT